MTLNEIPGWDAEITDGSSTVRIISANRRSTSLQRMPRGQGVEPKEVSQSSWVGGRGATVLGADPDKFSDSYNAWTHNEGQVTPGPLVRWASIKNEVTGKYHYSANWPGDGFRQQYAYRPLVIPPGGYLAVKKWDHATDYDITKARIVFLAKGDMDFLHVEVWSDAAGMPGAKVVDFGIDGRGELRTPSYCTAYATFGTLSSNQWIVFWYSGASNVTIYGGDTDVSLPSYIDNNTGLGWVATYPAYYTVFSDNGFYGSGLATKYTEYAYRTRFFEHREGLYAIRRLNVYLNGDRGQANLSPGAANVTSPNAWTTNCFRGCVFKVVGGPSAIIMSNTTLGYVVFDRDLNLAGFYEYVILGSDRFMHVATMSAECTDVANCNNGVYLAQGESVDMLKFRFNTATWLHEIPADTGSKAHFLKSCVRAGAVRLYRVNGSRRKFSYALPGSDIFAAALTWNTDSPVVSDDSVVQRIMDYDGAIWATTNGGVYSIQDTGAGDVSVKRPGPSESEVLDDSNGRGATWWNTNLYFGYMDGFMRLYGRTVDDIGPNRDEGMPLNRRGTIISAQPIFGFMACAVSSDRAQGWISSILATPAPGGSWGELFRGLIADYSIDNLYYQNIPILSNRLWFSHGGHPCYMFMPNSAQNPLNDTPSTSTSPYTGMVYSPGALLKTSWIDHEAPEREHDWSELRVYTENLAAAPYGTIRPAMTIWPSTRTDLTAITTSPYQYQNITQVGNRAQLEFSLEAGDSRIPPVLRSFTLRGVQMNEVRYDVRIDFEHADNIQLVNYEGDAIDADMQTRAVLAVLDSWQEKSTRLTLRTRSSLLNGITGHIEPVPYTLMAWDEEQRKIQGSIMFRQV